MEFQLWTILALNRMWNGFIPFDTHDIAHDIVHAAQVGSGRRLPEHREFRGRCDTGRGCTWIGLEDLSIKKTRLEVQAWKILTLS